MKLAFICILLLFTTNCIAQEQDGKRLCPRFIVQRRSGELLEKHFDTLYKGFVRYADTSAIYIKKVEFLKMLKRMISEDANNDYTINGFRIFFGQDSSKLKLIFTGLRDDIDVEEYFTINDDGNMAVLSNKEALRLVKNYDSITLPYTDSVLHAHGGAGRNTINYIYNKGLIYDILSEVAKQKNNRIIGGLKFNLGAYPDTNFRFRNRIMIGFTFVKNNKSKSEVYIEELPHNTFGCEFDLNKRYSDLESFFSKKISTQAVEKKQLLIDEDKQALKALTLQAINADTGTPCPPGSGCGTSTLNSSK